MKAHHHLTFFILILCGVCLLFFSSELLLPESVKKLIFRFPEIDSIGHFIGFFVLTCLVSSILHFSPSNTFYSLCFYSALSELGQYYLGFRNGEFSDFCADVAGISCYLLLKYSYSLYKLFTLKRLLKIRESAKVQTN